MNRSLELYNVPKVRNFDKNRLFQHNKVLHILSNHKVCEHLLGFMDLRDIFNLSATSKLSKSYIISHPSLLRIVSLNVNYDRLNIETTKLHQQVERMRGEIESLDQEVIKGIKRYLYYNYSILGLVENLVDDSMNSIEQLKVDLGGKAGNEQSKKNMMSFLKKTLNIKEEKAFKSFKFNRVKKMPIEIQTKVVEMLDATPFEKFILLDTNKKKIEINSSKEYQTTQNKLFKEEIDKTATEYMIQFTNLMMSMGRVV